MIAAAIALLAAGALTKIADNFADEKKKIGALSIAIGAAYGALFGYAMATNTFAATVVLGVMAANLLAGKFNSIVHIAGLVASATVIVLLGVFYPVLAISLIFLAAALTDEWLNDGKILRSALKKNKFLKFIAQHRLVGELAGIAVSIATMQPLYFLAILIPDAGYQIAEIIWNKFVR